MVRAMRGGRAPVIQESGELVGQVLEAAYNGGERPKGFKGQVYLPAECP